MARVTPVVAAGAEAVGVSAADQDRSRAHAQRLDDVAAAADAAVEQDFGLAADGLHHFRQDADRRRHAIELARAMIRHDDRRRAFIATARRASSAVCTPFATIGPPQASRIHLKSSHDVIDASSAAPTSA